MANVSNNAWLNNRFEQLDTDRDGYITVDDFVRTVHDAARALGRPVTGPEAQRAEREIRSTWTAMSTLDTDGDGRLSRKEFAAAFAADPNGLTAVLEAGAGTSNAFFDLCDVNGDGQIDVREFTLLMESFQVPAEVSATVFSRIDANGDNVISRDEYTDAWVHIYTTDFLDESVPASR